MEFWGILCSCNILYNMLSMNYAQLAVHKDTEIDNMFL